MCRELCTKEDGMCVSQAEAMDEPRGPLPGEIQICSNRQMSLNGTRNLSTTFAGPLRMPRQQLGLVSQGNDMPG